jgi:hypothetical protein
MSEANSQPEKPAFDRLQRWKQRVIDHIVRGDTPTQAVRRVKPTSKRPEVIASKLRYEPLYVEALEERRAQAIEDAGIVNAQILLGIAQLANVNVKALVWCADEVLPEGVTVGQPKKLHELDDVTARCIQSIEYSKDGEIKVRFPDRLAARKLLGQYKRLFTESHEINLGEATLEQLAAQSWNKPKAEDGPRPVSDS